MWTGQGNSPLQVTDSCVLMGTTWGCFEDKMCELWECIMQIQMVVSVPLKPLEQTSSSSAWQPFKYSKEEISHSTSQADNVYNN